MREGVPRRLIEETLTRWTLAKLKLVVVEGPCDQRFMQLVQNEPHCNSALIEVDVWPVEAIEVPSNIIEKHGLYGVGAKQRVIAFAREMEIAGEEEGFRGIIDKDIDSFLNVNHCSSSVLYTDYGCMDAYLWNVDVLRRLVITFKCEGAITTDDELGELFSSISSSCADITAVRIAAGQHPEWGINLHQSEKSLEISQKRLRVNIPMYVEQCRPAKGCLNDAKELVKKIRSEIEGVELLDLLNGHDLIWLLTYALKTFTKATRRTVEEETVFGALVAMGVMNSRLTDYPMFKSLANWSEQAG